MLYRRNQDSPLAGGASPTPQSVHFIRDQCVRRSSAPDWLNADYGSLSSVRTCGTFTRRDAVTNIACLVRDIAASLFSTGRSKQQPDADADSQTQQRGSGGAQNAMIFATNDICSTAEAIGGSLIRVLRSRPQVVHGAGHTITHRIQKIDACAE